MQPHPNTPLLRRPARLAGLLAGLLLLLPVLRAVDVSGVYESVGSDLPEKAGAPSTPVALGALFYLELDHAAGLKEQSETASVQHEQGDNTFAVRGLDADGKTKWLERWDQVKGYIPTGDLRPRIYFRAPHLGDRLVTLTMSLEANGSMLVVELAEVSSGATNATAKSLGTFLFHRAETR